jgi:hypothetical protein
MKQGLSATTDSSQLSAALNETLRNLLTWPFFEIIRVLSVNVRENPDKPGERRI